MATEMAEGSIEALADDDDALGEALDGDAGEQMTIPGTAQSLNAKAGGPDPTTSSVKLIGGEIAVEGQFGLGDRISLLVEVVVTEVTFRAKTDSDGGVVTVTRQHKARATGVARSQG